MIEQMIWTTKQIMSMDKKDKKEGQGLIEYALIMILISIVVILVLGVVGGQVNGMFEAILNGFNT